MSYESTRLQTPEDANGRRRDVHLETISNAVVVIDEKGVSSDLTSVINDYIPVQISEAKPKASCLWIRNYNSDIIKTGINDEWEVDYVYTSESEMNSHVKNIPIGAFVLVYDPSASGASCNNVAHGAIEIGESNTNVKAAKVFCYAAPGTSADTPALVATY